MKTTPLDYFSDDERQVNWKRLLLIILVIGVLVGSAFAVYKITSPPSDPVHVTTPATLSKPTVNATTAVVGNTLHISTQLSDKAQGVQVFFYQNNTAIGSDYTNDQGIATYDYVLAATGTYVYKADCIHP